ncbi:MAG: dTDP-4-dehydrorhamnose reductase [Chloroflexota bacterium]
MRIAITGANGQVGLALQSALSGDHDVIPLVRPDFEITQPAISKKIAELKPDLVIHPAAMTNVDGCAQDPATAYLVNGFGTQNVALACLQSQATMVYISTNEVFDGTASAPYHEYAKPNPINPYAASKLAGENMVTQLLSRAYIVRISWVFTKIGSNFPAKIIQAADKHGQLRVVTDEVSSPTYAPDLAQAIAQLILTDHYGIYHLSNSGICSRYEYTLEILRQSDRSNIPVEPITSADFDRASTPPAYAPLQNNLGAALDIRLRSWQDALVDYFS